MKAIEEKRYGSVVRASIAVAAGQISHTFLDKAGEYAAPTSLDPATGVVQNLDSQGRIANGDLLIRAVGMKVIPYLPTNALASGIDLYQKFAASYAALGSLQLKQGQTEIVNIMGAEIFEPAGALSLTTTSGAIIKDAPVLGKILPLNQPRLILKDQTLSLKYFTYAETSTSLTGCFIYAAAFVAGQFFDGGIRNFPKVMQDLGIDPASLPA